MNTVRHIHTHPDTQPDRAFDNNVSTVVRTMMTFRRLTIDDICTATAMSRSTYYNRIRGDAAWLAAELADLGDLFDLPVSAFYEDAELLIARSRCSPALMLVSDNFTPELPFGEPALLAAVK